MPEPRSVWIGNEPVAVPGDAKVVHLQGERMALVAVPRWTVHLLMSGGTLETPDESTNSKLLAEYFPELQEDSEKILNLPEGLSPSSGLP